MVFIQKRTANTVLSLTRLITIPSFASQALGYVALIGNMAFIGLMIPHMVRPIVGPDYRFVLPMSAIVGASFMLVADTLSRTINAPYETPIAAIIAITGLPFFLFIVRKGGKAFS